MKYDMVLRDGEAARAAKLAKAMTADPYACPNGDNPWTADDVIRLALMHGLTQLEERYRVNAGPGR